MFERTWSCNSAADEPGIKSGAAALIVRSNNVCRISEEMGGVRFVRRKEDRVHRAG